MPSAQPPLFAASQNFQQLPVQVSHAAVPAVQAMTPPTNLNQNVTLSSIAPDNNRKMVLATFKIQNKNIM